jgi:four helix bundle protein
MSDALDDLVVYQLASEAEKEIVAILARPAFGKHSDLREQMDESAARVPRHIREGHGQKTDRQFANFVFLARGEAQEMCGHVNSAHVRKFISPEERQDYFKRYERIAKMLGGLGRHLLRENRQLRA